MNPHDLYATHVNLPDAILRGGAWFPPRGADWGDLRQQARLALWSAALTYRPERGTQFRSHAWRVITRRLADWLEEQGGRERRYEVAVAAAEEWTLCMEPWREPDFDGQMTLRVVWRRLSPRQREALYLAVGEGYTSGELAARWGCTPKQADNQIAHARRQARRLAAEEQR